MTNTLSNYNIHDANTSMDRIFGSQMYVHVVHTAAITINSWYCAQSVSIPVKRFFVSFLYQFYDTLWYGPGSEVQLRQRAIKTIL